MRFHYLGYIIFDGSQCPQISSVYQKGFGFTVNSLNYITGSLQLGTVGTVVVV